MTRWQGLPTRPLNPRECPFCQIHEGRAPATVAHRWRGQTDVAIVPLNPVTAGHLLIVPVDHITDPADGHVVVGRSMGRAAWLAKREGYASFNIILSYGADATQTVEHVHVHLIPRTVGDGLVLPWDPKGEGADR